MADNSQFTPIPTGRRWHYLIFPVIFGIYHVHYLMPCNNPVEEDAAWKIFYAGLYLSAMIICTMAILRMASRGAHFTYSASFIMYGVELVKEAAGINIQGVAMDTILTGTVSVLVAVGISIYTRIR